MTHGIQAGSPKLMAPRMGTETRRPLLPSCRYSAFESSRDFLRDGGTLSKLTPWCAIFRAFQFLQLRGFGRCVPQRLYRSSPIEDVITSNWCRNEFMCFSVSPANTSLRAGRPSGLNLNADLESRGKHEQSHSSQTLPKKAVIVAIGLRGTNCVDM